MTNNKDFTMQSEDKIKTIFIKNFGISLNKVEILSLEKDKIHLYKDNFFKDLSIIDSFFKELTDLGFKSINLYNHLCYEAGFAFRNGEFCKFGVNHYGESWSVIISKGLTEEQTQKNKNKEASILFCKENNISLNHLAYINFLLHYDKSIKGKQRLNEIMRNRQP